MSATEQAPLQTTVNKPAITGHDDHPARASAGELDYLRDLARHDRFGVAKFGLALPLTRHQGAASRDALAVARLVALRHEDCGPCVQIGVDWMLKDGVDKALIRQILDGDVERLPEDLRPVYELTRAVVEAAPEASHWSDVVSERMGRKALASIALAIASVRLFPTIKRAFGYARSCSLVTIRGLDERAA